MAKADLPTIYETKPDTPKEKKIEKVIDGDEFVTRKRPLGKRVGDIFLKGDIDDVRSYVINDVLIPAVKETIFDMVNKGLDMLLFNSTSSRSSRKSDQTYISYNNYSYKDYRRTSDRSESRKEPVRSDDEELIFRDRGPAEMVLERMYSIFREYHIVTKADLNDLLNRTGNFTDNNWGLTDMTGACVERVRGGYLLKLPRWKHLD